MAASNKPTAVHFSLIFFVMLSIVLGVTTYMFHRNFSDATVEELKAKASLASANTALKKELDNVTALKTLLGKNFDVVLGADPNDINTVIGSMNEDLRNHGKQLAESTYSGTLAKLRQALDTAEAERDSKTTALASSDTEVRALQTRYSGTADSHQKARQAAETDLRKTISDRDEIVAAKDSEISKLKNDTNQVQLELDQEKEGRARDNKSKQDEIDKLIAINRKKDEELQRIRNEIFDTADGYVRRVDNVSRMIWLNIGDADFLKPRMTFSIYGKETAGVGRSVADIKGKVEVTRIIDAHLSEAKIIEEDTFRPISPGDAAFTPLWSPGRVEKFALVGIIDLDGDGRSDRDLLKAELATRGADLAIEVDEAGVRAPDGVTIDESFKYLILGKIPDLNNAITPEEKSAASETMAHFKAMSDEARLHGVRPISISEFMEFIGYKPKQRLFRPGDNKPFNLKAGAASTGIDEGIGDRTSSGQTGGNYNRSKTQQPDSSAGQTSKLFGKQN